MLQLLFSTNNDFVGLVARLLLGIVLLPHGAQKMLGWFGGYGFSGTMNYFTATRGLPWIVGALVIVIEFVGALGLILGAASRFWAFAIVVLMIGIIFSSHINNGFFMDWYGANPGNEGYEFHLLAIGLALAVLIGGGGKFAVDGLLTK